ncbi:MAG: glutamate synthase-related protein [Methylocystaceae bacterium]
MVVTQLISSFTGALIGSLLTGIFTPIVVNWTIDKIIRQLITSPSTRDPLLSYLYEIKNVPLQVHIETARRAFLGRPLLKPYESSSEGHSMDQLKLNPGDINRWFDGLSIDDIDISTQLGANSRHPLKMPHPIILASPVNGIVVSETALQALADAASQIGAPLFIGGQSLTPLCGSKSIIPTMTSVEELNVFKAKGLQPAMTEIRLSWPDLIGKDVWKDREQNTQTHMYRTVPPLINSSRNLRETISSMREVLNGAPIAVRLWASDNIENDISLCLQAGADVLLLETRESGSILAPAILMGQVGLPMLEAIKRAKAAIKPESSPSLVIAGGLWEPGSILKALAMGADAVVLDTVLLYAMLEEQIEKAVPWHPLGSLYMAEGKIEDNLNREQAANSLVKYLNACLEEIKLGLLVLGKRKLSDLQPEDLLNTR